MVLSGVSANDVLVLGISGHFSGAIRRTDHMATPWIGRAFHAGHYHRCRSYLRIFRLEGDIFSVMNSEGERRCAFPGSGAFFT